ncbi:hypothetical protein V6N13_043511 [Hibiscus sabdariffa]|uniref:Uncharacterized protein n=1 Tax=Hibiscus sabdariffa TaxID=183260 RepID=A0ABR2G1F4_9ROSI
MHDDLQEVNVAARVGRTQGGSLTVASRPSDFTRRDHHGIGDGTKSDSVEVVSLNDGRISEMVSRKVMSGSGSHLAFSVHERDSDRKHNGRVRLGGAGLVGIRGNKDNVSKGIHVKKPAGSRSPGKFVLVEWVHSTTQRLESLANQTAQNGVHEALPLIEDDPGPLNPLGNHIDAMFLGDSMVTSLQEGRGGSTSM